MSRLLGLAAAAVLAVGAPAAAAAGCPKTTLGDVEDEVMCPVCGTPLALATDAPQAKQQRAFIADMVDSCRSKDEIRAALVAEFGEGVLALPDDEGFNLAAVLVPGLAVLLGGAGVVVASLRWRGRRREPDERAVLAGPAGGDPSDSERLEADLRRYDL